MPCHVIVEKIQHRGFFVKVDHDKLYHRDKFQRLIVCFVVEIRRFVCEYTTPPIIKILQSKGILCTHMAFLHTTREPEIN